MELELAYLQRFCYLQSYRLNFNNGRIPLDLKVITPDLMQLDTHIKQIVAEEPKVPFDTIKKVLQQKNLPRMNETWYAIAVCLRLVDNKDLKQHIYDTLADLIHDPDDFLLFVFYYGELKAGNFGFGYGMKRFIKKWYNSRTANELVDMLSSHRKLYGVQHRTIVKLAKVKLENPEKQEILQTLFKKNKDLVPKEDSSAAFKRLCTYHSLKRASTPDEVVDILKKKELNYQLEHLPSIALDSVKVWEIMLPLIPVKCILDNLVKMQGRTMLKHETFAKKISIALANYKPREKLNPIYVFFAMRAYETKCHVQELARKSSEEKPENGNCSDPSERKDIKETNPFIVKKMYSIINTNFLNNVKSGIRYHITIDFRKFSKHHERIFNNHQVTCAEAQLLLALSLLKSEKEVSLFTFTDDKKALKPIDFSKEITFEKAMEYYQKEILTAPKTKQELGLPMIHAKNAKKRVDMFIIVVDSIQRTLGGIAKPPIAELIDYRKSMNLKMTKLVVINLTKKDPAFKDDDPKGVLEVNGLGPETLPIIEAFAKHNVY